jgi:hypothetical protein
MKNFMKKLTIGLVVVLTMVSVTTVAFAVDYDDPPKDIPTVVAEKK